MASFSNSIWPHYPSFLIRLTYYSSCLDIFLQLKIVTCLAMSNNCIINTMRMLKFRFRFQKACSKVFIGKFCENVQWKTNNGCNWIGKIQ